MGSRRCYSDHGVGKDVPEKMSGVRIKQEMASSKPGSWGHSHCRLLGTVLTGLGFGLYFWRGEPQALQLP